MSILVKHGGLLTTIQDLGRTSYQKYGVVVGGVMDVFSHKLANLLVGNHIDEATLEVTLLGPELLFLQDTIFAICGAPFQATLNNAVVPFGRPIFAKKGSSLKIGNCHHGCRAYLAFQGGIDSPIVLQSRSTFERGKLGGLNGRRLQKEDIIPLKVEQLSNNFPVHHESFSTTRWFVNSFSNNTVIRVIKGRHFSLFSNDSIQTFVKNKYEIMLDSDRMGYRLKGEKLSLKSEGELLSEATAFGTVQIPGDGQPIILMADRQPTGGYPKIANVITVDLPLLAQRKPGDKIKFKEVSLAKAQTLYVEQEVVLKKMSYALKKVTKEIYN